MQKIGTNLCVLTLLAAVTHRSGTGCAVLYNEGLKEWVEKLLPGVWAGHEHCWGVGTGVPAVPSLTAGLVQHQLGSGRVSPSLC